MFNKKGSLSLVKLWYARAGDICDGMIYCSCSLVLMTVISQYVYEDVFENIVEITPGYSPLYMYSMRSPFYYHSTTKKTYEG